MAVGPLGLPPDLIDRPSGPFVLVAAMICVRLLELRLARRNTRWALAHGGVEHAQRYHPVMVALHVALLAGVPLEVAAAHRPFVPAVAWTALLVLAAVQGVRWWCMHALGPRWNTRVIVVPGMPLVAHGPYRRLRHPNYLAVVAEGAALPMVYDAWLTAVLFTAANTVLLALWVRVEDRALRPGPEAGPGVPATTPDLGGPA